jgi:hypothetical protein
MVRSGYFGDSRDVVKAAVKIMAGRELGIGPFQSMAGIYEIRGKLTLSANLIAATVRRSRDYDYKVQHLDDGKCTIEFFRNEKPIGVSTFTTEDARKAGLVNGDNWRKYPRNMLFARAMSNGARWYCPDVFGSPVYTPDELGAVVDAEEGNVIDVSPEPAQHLPAKVTIDNEQVQQLDQLIQRKGADTAKLLSYCNAQSLSDLTPEQFEYAVGKLSSRPDVTQEPHVAEPASETVNCIQEN